MQPVLNCGGNWNNGDNAGLWNWNGNNSSSNANSNIGGRILIENYYVAHTVLAPWQKTLRKEDGLVGLFSKDREEIKRNMKRVGFLYPYAPKWKLKLIVSNHAKKLNSEVRRNEIQQSKVVRVC